jgi:diacylglycerol kinase (ATP)
VRLCVPDGGPDASLSELTAAAADSDAVWVCGGDGMVHLAVNVLAGGQIPLGVIPAGTGNDSAAVLGMDPDPVRAARQLVEAMRAGSVERVDLGRCDGPAMGQGRSGRWFLGMLYAGFDSAVNERANTLRWPRGRRKYDVAIVLELLRLRPTPIVLRLDDDEVEVTSTLVAIGNGPRYGGGKVMVPDARWDDGTFDITLVGPVSRSTLARLAPTLSRAGHIGHPAVRQFRSRSVQIAGDGPIAYADGERVGPLPIAATCVPQALPMLMPRRP